MKSLVIVGAGGFGREVQWLVQDSLSETFTLKGFLDQKFFSAPVNGLPVLGNDEWAREEMPRGSYYSLAIADPQIRKVVYHRFLDSGWESPILLDRTVRCSDFVDFDEGTIICAGTSLTTNIRIGKCCHLNLHCTVGHDVIIGDFVTISPGCHISGNVHIGAKSIIGTGAVILPGVQVGEGCTIGAGAVVNRDCEAGGTYVGVPARILKKRID